MGWSAQFTFPTIIPVMDDDGARKVVNAMIASLQL
tara:strand:- start:1276 stop:1380 length:105 start_codon:yes stop_codon:yes gene_type:complete